MDLQDFLYIVLALCAILFTSFLCWFLFQIIIIVRKLNTLLNEIKAQFERIDASLGYMKEKFHESSGYMQTLAENVKAYINRAIGRG
ncbi:MAG: hypothetical protein ABH826_03390 [Patescibacteria group bacterium]|nr:hypothetical protein [Patescibacteria group bacterium]